jgi:hypothetical protein
MNTYVDITIECVRCKIAFTWTAGEQSFFARQSFARPKVCKACRAARRLQRAAEAQAKALSYDAVKAQTSSTPVAEGR